MSRLKGTIGLIALLSLGMALLLALPYAPGQAAPAEPAAPTPTPAPPGAESVTLMGHVGGQTGAVYAQGDRLYAGFGPELAILDTSTPTQPLRLGYVMLNDDALPSDPAATPTPTARQTDENAAPNEVGGYSSLFINDVVVSGTHAYVAGPGGLWIVDVSDPAAPAKSGFYRASSGGRGVTVVGSYAYLAAGNNGLRVVDISNPAHPLGVSFYFTQHPTLDVVVSGDYAYVVDGGSLYVVNVSDPRFPVSAGFYDDLSSAQDVAVVNNLAYVAAGSDGLRVLNIADPQNISKIGAYNTSGSVLQISVNGNYAYLLEKLGALRIVDISDPAHPVEVGAYTPPDYAQKMSVAGDYIYLADDDTGVWMVDISNPAAPVVAGCYRTFRYPQSIALSPVADYAYVVGYQRLYALDISDDAHPTQLSSYALPGYFHKVTAAGNYAYIAAWSEGLLVIDMSDPTAPVEIGAYEMEGETLDAAAAGDYAYIASRDKGLVVVDVSDPANPVEVSSGVTGLANGVAVAENYAYLIDNVSGNLRVVDISNPITPTQVGSLYLEHWDLKGITAANGRVYVVGSGGKLWIVDVSNPVTPIQAGYYRTLSYSPFYDVAVAGNYACIAVRYGLGGEGKQKLPQAGALEAEDEKGGGYYSTGGLLVIDVSDPAAPAEAGYFSTRGEGVSVAAAGDTTYLVDSTTGLFSLRKITGISGKVTDFNDTSFPGVTISAGSGLSATTRWQSGAYTLNPPVSGTYTLTPALPGFAFLPPARTVAIPPDARNQDFAILAAPVSISLQPGVAASLAYTDTQGLPTRFTFPVNAVSRPITLVLTPTLAMTAEGRLRFAGHAFELAAYQSGGASLPNFVFDSPVTVTLAYSYRDIGHAGDENTLSLWRMDGPQGVNAAEDCGPSSPFAYWRDKFNHVLQIPVCKTGGYGLFGTTPIERAITVASVRDSANNDASLALQKATAMSLGVLVPLSWDTLEVRNGEYEWAQLDDILHQAGRHGARRVILRVYHAPPWYTPPGATRSHPPTNPQALYNFMFAMVTHLKESAYAGLLRGYVIWNEPNIPIEWGEQTADPAAYLALLQAAYQGAKAADPDAVIVSAPLAPTATGNGAINDLDYLAQLYDAGLSDTVDIIGMNGLGFQHDPDYDTGSPDYSFTRLKYLHQVMVDKGDRQHPAWALEAGWLRDSPYDMGDFEAFKVSEEEQAQYLHRAWQKAESEWLWLETIVFWNLDYNRHYPPTSNFHWYSIADTLAELYLTPPGPVSAHLTPGVPANLYYPDPRGVYRLLNFPANAVDRAVTITMSPTRAGGGSGYLAVGNGFELKVYEAGSLQLDFAFAAPVQLIYDYGGSNYDNFDQQVAAISDESRLTLWRWDGAAWQDAAQTCDPPSNYIRDTEANTLEVNICRSGHFVLVGPTHPVYLPLIFRM